MSPKVGGGVGVGVGVGVGGRAGWACRCVWGRREEGVGEVVWVRGLGWVRCWVLGVGCWVLGEGGRGGGRRVVVVVQTIEQTAVSIQGRLCMQLIIGAMLLWT